jgi:plastocyanin
VDRQQRQPHPQRADIRSRARLRFRGEEPGETVEIGFPAAGSFLVFCGIHPKMELYVDVVP